jgi:hypothetical protein
MMQHTDSFVAVVLLTILVASGPAVAADNTTNDSVGQQLAGKDDQEFDIGGQLQKAITAVLMDLVRGLANTLNEMLTRIFTSYPNVKDQRVLELHHQVFQISLALSSVAAAWIGLLHMLNRVDGVRPLLTLLGAVALGAVAPSLLWYPVELSRLTTEALASPTPNLLEVSRFTFELFLVLLIDVFLLLGTVVLFLARDVFLMFGVAVSPLIALMAATPKLRAYADTLTSVWLACLLIGPIDVILLNLTVSFMKPSYMAIPDYLWGLAGIMLLLGVPLTLLGAGVAAFAPLTSLAQRTSGMVQPYVWEYTEKALGDRSDDDGFDSRDSGRRERRGNRFRRDRGDD